MRARLVGVDLDVVADPVGREDADHAAGGEPVLALDPVEHGLGVGEELACLFGGRGVVEHVGVAALDLPGEEERRPVDVAPQLGHGEVVPDPGELGRRAVPVRVGGPGPAVAALLLEQVRPLGPVRRPVDDRPVGDRLGVARQRPLAGLRGVPHPDGVVVLGDPVEEGAALPVGEQLADHRHRPGGVLHPDDRPVVLPVDLHRGVRSRGRGATQQQRDVEALALHLARDAHHLVEAGRDQAGQPDDVGADLLGGVEDLLGGHHDPEVDDVVVVALQHHADDVLADVVHVALDRGRDDQALAALLGGLVLLGLDERDEVCDSLLHHPRRLHDLRQEHLAVAEQVTDDVHAVHQRALDDLERPPPGLRDLEPQLLGVLDHEGVDALHQGVRDALTHRQRAPLLCRDVGRPHRCRGTPRRW